MTTGRGPGSSRPRDQRCPQPMALTADELRHGPQLTHRLVLPEWLSVLVDGLEVAVECPGGELPADLLGGGVGGAEVNPLPHPGIDDIPEQCVAAVVVALDAGRRRGGERQLQMPGFEQNLESMSH